MSEDHYLHVFLENVLAHGHGRAFSEIEAGTYGFDIDSTPDKKMERMLAIYKTARETILAGNIETEYTKMMVSVNEKLHQYRLNGSAETTNENERVAKIIRLTRLLEDLENMKSRILRRPVSVEDMLFGKYGMYNSFVDRVSMFIDKS